MPDNKQIKDGLGDIFTIRMRDLSPLQDGSVQRSMIYATAYPIDYGAGGIYQLCAKSGVIGPYMQPNAPIFSFQWPSGGMLALITRIKLAAWTVTAFTPGNLATFDLFVARSYSIADSGGLYPEFGGGMNQLRSSMAAAQAQIEWANTGALNPGTRTLDQAPLESTTVQAPDTDNTPFIPTSILWQHLQGEHPLYLVQNEGFIVQANVPNSNSTWQFAVTLEWAEVQNY